MEHVRKRSRNTGTMPQPAERDVLVHAADPAELGGIKLGLIIFHERLHDRGCSPCAKLGPVLGSEVIDVVRRSQRPCARHVLWHHGRVSWNKSPEETRAANRRARTVLPRAPADFRLSGFGLRQAASVNARHGHSALARRSALALANPPPWPAPRQRLHRSR
jgi:hypothetical protein